MNDNRLNKEKVIREKQGKKNLPLPVVRQA